MLVYHYTFALGVRSHKAISYYILFIIIAFYTVVCNSEYLSELKLDDNTTINDFYSNERLFGSSLSENSCLVNDEIHLTAPELIRRKGFPFQAHEVTTKDGYILELHRIPKQGKPVVVAFHGMFQSSRDFLMNCGKKALAYKMYDADYDVWLANVRGNCYSRCHKTLNADTDTAYWNFTVDDVIKYDAPALIDYILQVTNQQQLNWIGYSLGTAVALGLGSVHPEYNNKINIIFLLGTTAYNGNTKSPLLRALAPLASVQDTVMTALNHGESLPLFLFPIMRSLFPLLCYPEAKTGILGMCSYFLYIVAGFDQAESNPFILPMMLGGTPQSLAIKMLSQWYQWINNGNFSYYNYGSTGNLQKYGSLIPPNYDLKKVTTKVVNMWAENDWLSVPEDVQKTVRSLPNVILNFRIKLDTWNHLDFIYGKNADIYVYDEIISILKNI